jgi:hypothetical protein
MKIGRNKKKKLEKYFLIIKLTKECSYTIFKHLKIKSTKKLVWPKFTRGITTIVSYRMYSTLVIKSMLSKKEYLIVLIFKNKLCKFLEKCFTNVDV